MDMCRLMGIKKLLEGRLFLRDRQSIFHKYIDWKDTKKPVHFDNSLFNNSFSYSSNKSTCVYQNIICKLFKT